MSDVKMVGLDEVLVKLNKAIHEIEGKVQKGLTLAMLEVKGKSMSDTPVDVGNLRGSHYLVTGDGTVSTENSFLPDKRGKTQVGTEHRPHVNAAANNAKSKGKPFAEVGCSAYYAESVHENLEARHVTGKAKFLEDAIKTNSSKILSTVKRFAKG
jgi:hypothetical protein